MREQSSQIIEENYRIWLEVEREGTLVNDIEIAEEKKGQDMGQEN